jgi:hypothetical protein
MLCFLQMAAEMQAKLLVQRLKLLAIQNLPILPLQKVPPQHQRSAKF